MAVVFYTRTGGTTAEHLIDQPYIIERPVNQVDFDAMMLEYNVDRQPSDTVQIVINATITSLGLMNNNAQFSVIGMTVELEQSWMDSRLMFGGKSEVQIPRHIRIWTPVTFARNALTENIDQSHIQVSPEGKVQLFEKRSIQSFVNSEQLNHNFTTIFTTFSPSILYRPNVINSFVPQQPYSRAEMRIAGEKMDLIRASGSTIGSHSFAINFYNTNMEKQERSTNKSDLKNIVKDLKNLTNSTI
ncbi:hypothetical protein WR25_17256 isoform C [Diploscapter pachys]|nr:hypothetical protein WR25_17256 isoform C [Diploscapter pachys]